MPRRIRLVFKPSDEPVKCDLTGASDKRLCAYMAPAAAWCQLRHLGGRTPADAALSATSNVGMVASASATWRDRVPALAWLGYEIPRWFAPAGPRSGGLV